MEKSKKAEAELKETEAHKIWNEIKEKSIDMFALPNQVVEKYCKPLFIEPNRLYLTISAASVLPSLEASLGEKYSIELSDKYLLVARASKKNK